jgi:hypothetical protein
METVICDSLAELCLFVVLCAITLYRKEVILKMNVIIFIILSFLNESVVLYDQL